MSTYIWDNTGLREARGRAEVEVLGLSQKQGGKNQEFCKGGLTLRQRVKLGN